MFKVDLNLNINIDKCCSIIEKDKSIFKIITKTKNENFFIEKWISHHLNILKDTKLVIFDNMSDDEYVYKVYEKYKDNIILIQFDWYMDCLHMVSWSKQLYKAFSHSSKFFTIIDSDEYLYLYNDNEIIKDNSIINFLEENIDYNFFVPCWIENIADNEKLLFFNPKNLSLFHLSKPIINTKLVPLLELSLKKYECPILHHTQDLPITSYGKTRTKFLLLHLKNLNIYQRIKSNMQKLVAFNIVRHDKDFFTLFNIDANSVIGHRRSYIFETRKLTENILHLDEKNMSLAKNEIIEICNDQKLKFLPQSHEEYFNYLMNSDYFDLIKFDLNNIDMNKYTTIKSCMHLF